MASEGVSISVRVLAPAQDRVLELSFPEHNVLRIAVYEADDEMHGFDIELPLADFTAALNCAINLNPAAPSDAS